MKCIKVQIPIQLLMKIPPLQCRIHTTYLYKNTSTTQEIQLQQTTCRCNLTTRTFFHSLFQTTNLSEKSSKVKCIFLYSMNAVKGAKSKTYFSVTYNSVETLILLVTFVF